jgi:hypothetical protein
MAVVSGYGLAANHDGRLEIVAIAGPGKGVADRVSTFWQERPNGDWSGRSALGRPDSGLVADSPPAIAQNADGRLEAAVVGGDFTIRHVYQDRPGGEWSGWWSLGQPETEAQVRVFGPVLAQNSDGRLELFVQGGDGAVWHLWQTTASTSAWGPWSSLGQPGGHDCGILEVAQNSDGRLELFTVASDGAVWHRWQRSAGGGWAPWSSLGIPPASAEDSMFVADLAVARNQDGRLELFAVASDSTVWHRWQRRAGGWAAWSLLGGFLPEFAFVAARANADGRLLLVAQWAGSMLLQREQIAPNSGWSPWWILGPQPSPLWSPTLATNQDGSLEQLWLIEPGDLFHFREAKWSEGARLPAPGAG